MFGNNNNNNNNNMNNNNNNNNNNSDQAGSSLQKYPYLGRSKQVEPIETFAPRLAWFIVIM